MSFILSERERDIEFEPINHVYTIKGVKHYKSVSKVLSDHLYDPFKEGNVSSAIRFTWDWIRERGTAIHLAIENYLNGVDNPPCTFEWTKDRVFTAEQEDKFQKQVDESFEVMREHIEVLFKGLTFLASEYKIYGKLPMTGDVEIPGMIDALYQRAPGEVVIVDWKTNSSMFSYPKTIENPKSPFLYTKKTKLDRYFCQLHIYKYILEQYYNVKVVMMIIFHYSPESGTVTLSIPINKCDCLPQ